MWIQRAHRAAEHTLERLGFDVATLEREREEALRRADVALAKLHESDATLAAVAEELGQYGSQVRNAKAEAQRLADAVAAAEAGRATDLERLASFETRLREAEHAPEEEHDGEHDGEEHTEGDGHDHGDSDLDPHFWQDPARMADLGDAVAEHG